MCVTVYFERGKRAEAVPQERLETGAQRARPPAREAGARLAAARMSSPFRGGRAGGSGRRRSRSWEHDGERWLVAPFGERNWVKNARASGWVELRRGRRRERHAIEEVDAEQAVPVLREYYRRFRVTRTLFEVTLEASREEWLADALLHPVFRLRSAYRTSRDPPRRRHGDRAVRSRRARVRVGPVEAAAATAREIASIRQEWCHVGIAGGRGITPGGIVIGSDAVYFDISAEIPIVDRSSPTQGSSQGFERRSRRRFAAHRHERVRRRGQRSARRGDGRFRRLPRLRARRRSRN